ncbi:exodeoxyribonuclease V subunit beta [Marilutibacter alkalisoli]|uniref:RecBCD enzyme subunit RecB n=1 Tax=Marilutibacter alkalisoli TaxID=2591633 RepID=A0A514BMY6_9GAMM|nr:exodeoxyribonuclease V subunit beta [Lysobacter alkalisoli]QDH68758.1 exodeoxyribonuclease V subunit beta [Lysobacter alkalisoli]
MSDTPRGPWPDPWLDLPLSGVRLIEASAGTGKTFTLATLVARLVVERDLRLAQILAVTFTEAATQELRKRIRERLQLALELVDGGRAGDESIDDGHADDGHVDEEPAAAALTRALLDGHRARSGETVDALHRRLQRAVDEIDLAAIFTIHGFCARVLREHALESGQGFDPPELLANDRGLREDVAADLWRAHATDAAGADDLNTLWKEGPTALAADLPALVREPVLLPPAPDADSDALDAAQRRLDATATHLQQAWQAHGESFFDALGAAIDGGVMNGNQYKPQWVAELRQWLHAWAADPHLSTEPHPKLEKLRTEALTAGTKKAHVGKTPASPPLNAAVADHLDALHAMEAARAHRRAALLHRLRDDARTRLATLKRQRRVQTYDDLIDDVADALDGSQGDALVRALRTQYRVALVDEFQDTDPRQWRIFKRVFGQAGSDPALFLIGDPKQAIYGFRGGDVHTYLAARADAEAAPALSHNFRSRPSLLRAIDALYAQAGNTAFVDERIAFHTLEPGGKRGDADFRRAGSVAPALTLWRAPDPAADDKGRVKPWSAPDSRALATAACVAAIHAVLRDERDHRAKIDGRAARPGDIAVLVRSHAEATRVQRALADVGIPAVAAGKQSLFATTEARELHILLLALLHGADDARLRAALATVLVGVDAAGIERLDRPVDDSSTNTHRHWQHQALTWRERLLRGGPLALVGELCAAQSGRLLGLLDGERRVSNYLQLAELLQEAARQALGLQGLVDWLGRRIASADENDEAQLLRLESDAHRVKIVTLHKSKGLEYPLVFLPFVGIGRDARAPTRQCVVHDATDGRRLHWKLDLPEAEWNNAESEWKQEQRAEDARLLYVGLTRAEHALWVAHGPFFNHERSPLSPMLRDLQALAGTPGIVLDPGAPPTDLPRLPPESEAAVPPAREASRPLSHDWWVYSFTQLAHADAGSDAGNDPSSASTLPVPGGQDEPAPVEDDDDGFDPRFAGTRFGVALHAALEHVDFAAWRGWRPGETAPDDEATVIAEALQQEGYASDELEDGIALTTALVGHTLTVALPEGTRLCEVPAGERRPEIEFQFSLQSTRVDALLQLLHAHGVVRERHGFGLRQRLEGLMTGLIDLTYCHDGRWYVLDYKSNRLPRYDAAALDAAMAHSEYDLQALIYTLALHRWLRFRLGDRYDYERDFGGIRYLFCRGLDATRDDSPGIHAHHFAPELVHALDALFAGKEPLSRPRERGWGEGIHEGTP